MLIQDDINEYTNKLHFDLSIGCPPIATFDDIPESVLELARIRAKYNLSKKNNKKRKKGLYQKRRSKKKYHGK